MNRATSRLEWRDVTIVAIKAVHSDIFLPRWFADRIPQLFGPPLVIGLLGLAYHRARSATFISTPMRKLRHANLPRRMGFNHPAVSGGNGQ